MMGSEWFKFDSPTFLMINILCMTLQHKCVIYVFVCLCVYTHDVFDDTYPVYDAKAQVRNMHVCVCCECVCECVCVCV